jgi:hypothetical protein
MSPLLTLEIIGVSMYDITTCERSSYDNPLVLNHVYGLFLLYNSFTLIWLISTHFLLVKQILISLLDSSVSESIKSDGLTLGI